MPNEGGFETRPYKRSRRFSRNRVISCSPPPAGFPATLASRGSCGQGGGVIESHLTQPLPQTEDGRHGAVGTLVGAGFKPALVPHARCNRITVISRALKVGRTISGSTGTP